jgi:hypothetical protein
MKVRGSPENAAIERDLHIEFGLLETHLGVEPNFAEVGEDEIGTTYPSFGQQPAMSSAVAVSVFGSNRYPSMPASRAGSFHISA